jgi:hypothetical protein
MIEAEFQMSVDAKETIEQNIKAGKNVSSPNDEMYSYVISSLLSVPENISLEGFNDEEASILKGATIESKLAVPDMQGFIKLIN